MATVFPTSVMKQDKHSVKRTEDRKVVFTNTNATVVIINGSLEIVKVTRPADKDHLDDRDMTFKSLHELEAFIEGARAVLIMAKKEMGS